MFLASLSAYTHRCKKAINTFLSNQLLQYVVEPIIILIRHPARALNYMRSGVRADKGCD